MRFSACIIVLVAGLVSCPSSHAQDAVQHWWHWPWSTERRPCACCPDDYVHRPMPAPPCRVGSCEPDDYCRKPMPITQPLKYCGVDDYCPKRCPLTVPVCYPPWYTCAPAAGCDNPKTRP